MVQYNFTLDTVFHSLSDPTRRDILTRVCRGELTISALAEQYDMSFSAVAKHLRVLEHAQLIVKQRRGKTKVIQANPAAVNGALQQLELYKQYMNERYVALDELLREDE